MQCRAIELFERPCFGGGRVSAAQLRELGVWRRWIGSAAAPFGGEEGRGPDVIRRSI